MAMRRNLCLIVLMISTIVASGCQRNVRDLSGTYVQQHIIQDGDNLLADNNILILNKIDKDRIEFCFHLVSTNAHMCELRGVALNRGDEYDYQVNQGNQSREVDRCILKIIPEDKTITLKDLDDRCRYYAGCGGFAYINNVYWIRRKGSSDFNCADMK